MKTIKIARIKQDLTQQQLADKLGISASSYNRIELGKQPLTVDMLNKISIVLNVSVTELLEGGQNNV